MLIGCGSVNAFVERNLILGLDTAFVTTLDDFGPLAKIRTIAIRLHHAKYFANRLEITSFVR